MSTYNVKSTESMDALNKHLSTNLFIGGNAPNAQDALTWELFENNAPNATQYPGITAWFYLVHCYAPLRDSWKTAPVEVKQQKGKETKEAKPKETKTKEAPKTEEVDDMFADAPEKKTTADNMFEDDPDEDPEEAKRRQERMKANLEAKRLKDAKKASEGKPKEVVIAKSLIMLDIKVWEQDQNLEELASKILKIELDGLLWKTEFKTPVIAFGMKKLVMGLVVEDEKVSVDDVVELIEKMEEEVQSVDIANFSKI